MVILGLKPINIYVENKESDKGHIQLDIVT